jgi:hypothetical protein
MISTVYNRLFYAQCKKNFYASDGIFLSKARNNPQECRKIPENEGKINST